VQALIWLLQVKLRCTLGGGGQDALSCRSPDSRQRGYSPANPDSHRPGSDAARWGIAETSIDQLNRTGPGRSGPWARSRCPSRRVRHGTP